MRVPGGTEARTLALTFLAGCAHVQQTEVGDPMAAPVGRYDQPTSDCIRASAGSREKLEGCLDRIPSAAGEAFNVRTLSMEAQRSGLVATREVHAERPEQFPATVEKSVGIHQGVNVTYTGDIATVRPAGEALKLDEDDRALAGAKSPFRVTRPTGEVIQISSAVGKTTGYASDTYRRYVELDFWTPEGAWAQWDVPFPEGTEDSRDDYVLGLHALSDGKVAFVVGDYRNDEHGGDERFFTPGKASLVVGGWESESLDRFNFDTPEKPFGLNGGFVEVDARTWLVSGTEGVLMTRNAGESWEKVLLQLPEGYPTVGVQSYHVYREGSKIVLSLAYPDKGGYANYEWDAQKQTWAYAGGEWNREKMLTGGAWDVLDIQGAPTSYQVRNILRRTGGPEFETVNSHAGQLALRHEERDATGGITAQEVALVDLKILNGRSVGWLEVAGSAEGNRVLVQFPDSDPSKDGTYKGTRLFLVQRRTPSAPFVTTEIQLPEDLGEIRHAHLLNGHVMVVYQTNPKERDHDKVDVRAIYVPLPALE